MAGYGELLQTMAAIVIFGLILMSANRMIQRNTMMQVEGELEQEVVAIAQDIIEEGRTLDFDENSTDKVPPTVIPDDFTSPENLGPDGSEEKRRDFNDFDDFHEWKDTLQVENIDYYIDAEVFYVEGTNYEKVDYETTFKKIRVNITNDYLQKSNADDPTAYYLEFIRNYYAD